jgi:hypothetical protein
LAEIELETQRTSFFRIINPEKMVNQVTAQKILQKTAHGLIIPFARRFTFHTVNRCLSAGYLTPQSIRVCSVPSDLTPPPKKNKIPIRA